MFAGIKDTIKMDTRSQTICDGFLRKSKQVVIWIFSIFLTTLPLPLTVLCFFGHGAEQNISKAIRAIMKRNCLLCSSSSEFQEEEPIRKRKSHIAGHISISSFVEHLSASNVVQLNIRVLLRTWMLLGDNLSLHPKQKGILPSQEISVNNGLGVQVLLEWFGNVICFKDLKYACFQSL